MHFIIIRDFNAILNKKLDRSNPREIKSVKPNPLHTWLQKQSFTNTYRTLYFFEKKCTWSNTSTSTRIDQVWVSEGLTHGLLEAGIMDMSMTIESDHDIITMCLNLSHLIANLGIAIVKRKAVKRTVFLYEEQIMHENKQDYLDEIWSIIERVIIEAANKSLPKKKVSNIRYTKAKEFNQTYMHRPILQISRWMRYIRDRLDLLIKETDMLEFNLTIEKINTDLQLEIQQAEDI
ncbi:15821_t:CDS:2 [Gigaspora margarita]|uniref:15821_t:CDS:1 n=1 Tax=Gigaspora margarita TaxID=4874 RepID=A0ABN7W248_GIGMA|nr:15821_t:CDS:2 [Gigaspora margarita]